MTLQNPKSDNSRFSIGSWRALCAVMSLLLSACGGGGGSTDNISTEQDNNIPTASSPVIRDGTVELDFSGLTTLYGKPVLIEHGVDELVNEAMSDAARSHDIGAIVSSTISIKVQGILGEGSIPIKVHINNPPQLAENQTLAIYVYNDVDDDDTGAIIMPLASTYSDATSVVQAALPWEYFIQKSDGTHWIRLQVAVVTDNLQAAVATGAGISTRAVRQSASRPISQLLQITCPLPSGCTEVSQFNTARKLPNWPAKPHRGTDYRAALSTFVYAPVGSRVTNGRSPAKYAAMLDLPGNNQAKKGSGIYVELELPGGRVRISYFHLSKLEPWVYDGQNIKINETVPAANGGLIGITGKSGTTNPHLHLEYSVYEPVSTRVRKDGSFIYINGWVVKDSFQAMIDSLDFNLPEVVERNINEPISLAPVVKDAEGKTLTSSVGNAVEAYPGEPTRKVCYTDLYSLSIWQHAFTGTVLTPRGEDSHSICLPWGTKLEITPNETSKIELTLRLSKASRFLNEAENDLVAYRSVFAGEKANPLMPVWQSMALPYWTRVDYKQDSTACIADTRLDTLGQVVYQDNCTLMVRTFDLKQTYRFGFQYINFVPHQTFKLFDNYSDFSISEPGEGFRVMAGSIVVSPIARRDIWLKQIEGRRVTCDFGSNNYDRREWLVVKSVTALELHSADGTRKHLVDLPSATDPQVEEYYHPIDLSDTFTSDWISWRAGARHQPQDMAIGVMWGGRGRTAIVLHHYASATRCEGRPWIPPQQFN